MKNVFLVDVPTKALLSKKKKKTPFCQKKPWTSAAKLLLAVYCLLFKKKSNM